MEHKIKFVAFDADDTLWHNEVYFHEFEAIFCNFIRGYLSDEEISKRLFETEMKNLFLYGYGIKGMVLCMIELAFKVVDAEDFYKIVPEIIRLGQELMMKPVELLDEVEDLLVQLSQKYELVLVTKGDLIDQERKISASGLKQYFCHIEIMSDKKESDYLRLLDHLGCGSENFLMLGNSLKSDIIPVLKLGAFAAYIPYKITWQHESLECEIEHPRLTKLTTISEILNYL